ncbi:MAG: SUF system NifU family Fe-S cluster assembly protein [Synechococcaceae cyanobacterium SM2_3_1]|nr:SUF system NifU family Fe-S cluster assembly protein [Synechococcaceae cyanobacterium SM2_3_1]
MSLDNLRGLYQQVILERYKKPRHRGTTDPVHRQQRGHNPSCGDTIDLTLQLDAEQARIEDVKFSGEGCAIAMASADLMSEALKGRSLTEALAFVEKFQNMMKGDGEFPREQRSLNAMKGVAQFPVRIKCATLPWHTLKYALESSLTESSGFISNESDDEAVASSLSSQ